MKNRGKVAENGHWKYIDYSDLVSAQIEITNLSYGSHSKEYALDWEWSEEVVKRTRENYLLPFAKYVSKGKNVLVVGCGTGRDIKYLNESGYICLGIDSSMGMLKEAERRINGGNLLLCAEMEKVLLVPDSFGGILIDSAAEHVRKSDIKQVLTKMYDSLNKGGILLVRFRLGSGKVFVVEDSVGKRYFTSYTKGEAKELALDVGFDLVEEYLSTHTDESRPGFFTLILRRS